MHSLLCNWRGQWCSKSCIPAFSTSTQRGEQPLSPSRVCLRGMISERAPTSVGTCCPYQLLHGASLPCPAGMPALLDVQSCTLQGHLSLWSMHTMESKNRLPDREQMHTSYGQDLPAPAALKHNSAPIPLLCHAHGPALAHFRNYLG